MITITLLGMFVVAVTAAKVSDVKKKRQPRDRVTVPVVALSIMVSSITLAFSSLAAFSAEESDFITTLNGSKIYCELEYTEVDVSWFWPGATADRYDPDNLTCAPIGGYMVKEGD